MLLHMMHMVAQQLYLSDVFDTDKEIVSLKENQQICTTMGCELQQRKTDWTFFASFVNDKLTPKSI